MWWLLSSCCGRNLPRDGEREPLLPEDALPAPIPVSEPAGLSKQDQLREQQRQAEAQRTQRAHDNALRGIVDQATEQIISLSAPAPFLHVCSSIAERPESRASMHSLNTINSRYRPRMTENTVQPSLAVSSSTTAEEDQSDVFHTAKNGQDHNVLQHENASRELPEDWSTPIWRHDSQNQVETRRPLFERIQILPSEEPLPVREQDHQMVCFSELPTHVVINLMGWRRCKMLSHGLHMSCPMVFRRSHELGSFQVPLNLHHTLSVSARREVHVLTVHVQVPYIHSDRSSIG